MSNKGRQKLRDISHNEALRGAIAYVMQATRDLEGVKPLVAVDLHEDDNGTYRLVLGVEADMNVLDEILDVIRGYYPEGVHPNRLADIKFARSEGWTGDTYRAESA